MEQLKKGLESGTVLIQFEVRDPWGLGGLPKSSPGGQTHRGTLRVSGPPGESRGGVAGGHGPSLNSDSPSCSSNDQ